jgi:hypothetical protein
MKLKRASAVNAKGKKDPATQILSCSRQSHTNVNIMPLDVAQQGNYLQCVRLKFPEAFNFQK